MSEPLPWERVGGPAPKKPGLSVELARCIGCHACSVACKTAHELPLGTFRMRVRWLTRPDRPQQAFLPLFDPESCDIGASARAFGLAPECVRACPTAALTFGEQGDLPPGEVPKVGHAGVRYQGFEPWMATKLNKGVPLSKDDADIIYEQR